MDELNEKILPFLKEHLASVILSLIGLIFLGYGLVTLSHSQTTESDNGFSTGDTKAIMRSPISPPAKQITIDIEGAVMKPGVYALRAEGRVQDALIAAGGLSQDADRQKVAQTLNLAAPLTDSAKIYIPAVGEEMAASDGSSTGSSGTGVAGSKTVNINQASESDLDALPGVGPVTAQKIISSRPYQSVQDLLDKKVVGASVFTKIKDQVSVY